MVCKKLFSKLLVRFLLVNVGVSYFGYCTYAMEKQNDEALEFIREKTHKYLIYKSKELVNDHGASDYETALLSICYNVDESFKRDLIDFIKQGYVPNSNNPRGRDDLFNALLWLSKNENPVGILQNFAMDFLEKSII